MWAGSIYLQVNFRMADFGNRPRFLAVKPLGRGMHLYIGRRCIGNQAEELD
jgi:hypothetical protein